MLQSLHLQGIGPVPNLEAQFGSRLNLLTGDNGLGKSFLLDIAFWALTGSWPGGRVALPSPPAKKASLPTITYQPVGKKGPTSRAKSATFDFTRQSWNRPTGRPVMPGLVIYATVDGGFAVWDPARNYWRDPAAGAGTDADQPRAYQFSSDTLANGLTEGTRSLCNGLVRDWVSWWDQRRRPAASSPAPIELLERVVERLSHPDEQMAPGQPRRVYLDDTREFPTIDMPYGNVAFPHLSAGVRRIVSLAYLVVWAWTEHCQAARLRKEEPTDRMVLLVDEIEAHLHPKWQRVILPALIDVAGSLGSQIELQIIAATHSPLVLASLEPLFEDAQDQLFLFELDQGKVTFENRPWTPQGDVVGWLTSGLFGLKQARSREAEQAIEAAEAFMRGDRAALPAGLGTQEQIQDSLLKVLPGLDPFWPRWIVQVQKQ